MARAKALLVGSLLALGCSSETSEAPDEPSPEDSPGLVAPTSSENSASNGGSSNSPTSNPARPSSEVPLNPQLQARPDVRPTPEPEPDAQQQTGAEPEPEPTQTPTATGVAPTIPTVTEECPAFQTGTITFMGLGGIQVVAGAKAASATAPMVFYWHGTGSTSREFGFMATAVRDGVEAEGGILVSFQGTTGGDLLSGTSIFGRSDIDLVDQLVACAVRDHNVDPRRIFTTGCSAGGLFASALAALRSEYIAAAAPNSGGFTFPQQFQNDFTPALMTVHGAPGRDVVGVDFSNTSATADRAFKNRGGFVVNCNHGGGHCGGGGLAPDIWEFFEAHPYGIEPAPSPWTSGLPGDFSEQCQIF